MRVQGRVRHSPAASGFGAIVGIGMTTIGFLYAIPLGGTFGVVWTLVAAGVTLFHGYNALSSDGIAHEVVDVDVSSASKKEPSSAERLRELRDLRDEGLVGEEEYEEQRSRILGSL